MPHDMKSALTIAAIASLVLGALTSGKTPSYQALPSLREQAQLQDKWAAERKAAIPELLQKHKVDAWIVSILLSILTRRVLTMPSA